MHSYYHHRYETVVKVNDAGKKAIHKHGLIFRTFTDLLEFEREYHKQSKQKSNNTFLSSNTNVDKDLYLKAKGEY